MQNSPPPGSADPSEASDEPLDAAAEESTKPTPAEEAAVRRQVNELRSFVRSLSGDDIRSGNWFEKLLAHSLHSYTEKVDAEYFRTKYPGLPADAVVDARIRLAARYAAIEGALSASAYTGAVVATLGTLSGASPITVPAAVTTLVVDVAFTTRLQLRLAYDIAVLYRIPLDLHDPEDLWKLIKVAFTIKSAEVAREGALKVVPAMVRPIVKAIYSGKVLTAAKGLPIVGKHLLQRTVVKVAIPAVGIPLATALNHYTTLIAGRQARVTFRNEARIDEEADRLLRLVSHDSALPWVAWAAVVADRAVSDDEKILMRLLVAGVSSASDQADAAFERLIDVDLDEVWSRVDASKSPTETLFDVAQRVAIIDGTLNRDERALLTKFCERFSLTPPPSLA